MSNKFIEKERLKAIWEEIKMLDILEIAKEEIMKEGRLEATRDNVIEVIDEFKTVLSKVLAAS